MNDNYSFSVGCMVRKKNQVLLVRHTYGNAKGNELPEEAAVREVLEETGITAQVKRMAGIRCDRKNWYLLLEMDYLDGIPVSDGCENSEVLFCEIAEALTRSDCTEITKAILKKMLDDSADYLNSNMEYKAHKEGQASLYI